MPRAAFAVWASLDIAGGRSLRAWPDAAPRNDPVAVGRALCASGARRLHVVDLDAARTGEPVNRAVVLEVARAVPCPLQVSGGLRSADDVDAVLAAGAERAVLSSSALAEETALRRALSRHRGRVAALLDVRGDRVGPGVPLIDAVRLFDEAGAVALIHTDLEREGTMSGPSLTGLRAVGEFTDLPLVAAGGIASLGDLWALRALRPAGVAGAIVGRSLYEGRITLAAAHRVADGPTSAGVP
ncbi:1-(5-phosphoribosyl)-5-[(5-phosphoribosylamino)methylideneamino]imidazole-4-carboxamide isomerase [soil metagenome]